MTQVDEMVRWFERHGGKATLGDILSSGERWAHEFNARKTDARKRGYVLILYRGKTPSGNIYHCIAPEPSGQMRIA